MISGLGSGGVDEVVVVVIVVPAEVVAFGNGCSHAEGELVDDAAGAGAPCVGY